MVGILLDPQEDVYIHLLLSIGLYWWHVYRCGDDGGAVVWSDDGCLDIICEVCGCWYRGGVFVDVFACCQYGSC
jgi:hypothetical protein